MIARIESEGVGLGSAKVAVAIPAYNEEKTIAGVIIGAQKHTDIVIVCDDGSEDLTGIIAKKLGAVVLTNETNMGKGEALRVCFREAREIGVDALVTIDADGQHNPDEIQTVVGPILSEDADIVIGSRFIKEMSDIPGYRKQGNRILNVLTTQSLKGISDTQSGFRAYSKKALSLINPGEMGMGVDSEILVEALHLGLRVTETPITVKYGIGKTSTHNPIYHTLDVFASIVKLTSLRHPLIFYGLPGLILTIIGVVLGLRSLQEFGIGSPLWLNYAFLSVTVFLLGILTGFVGLILFTLATLIRKK